MKGSEHLKRDPTSRPGPKPEKQQSLESSIGDAFLDPAVDPKTARLILTPWSLPSCGGHRLKHARGLSKASVLEYELFIDADALCSYGSFVLFWAVCLLTSSSQRSQL